MPDPINLTKHEVDPALVAKDIRRFKTRRPHVTHPCTARASQPDGPRAEKGTCADSSLDELSRCG